MKKLTFNTIVLTGALSLALSVTAQPVEESDNGQSTPPPAEAEIQPVESVEPGTTEAVDSVAAYQQGMGEAVSNAPTQGENAPPPESFVRQGTTPPRFVPPMKGTNAGEASAYDMRSLPLESTPPDRVVKDGEKGILMNFRNAPLEYVLNYLSSAAGFIIIPKTDVSGKVTVWSNQPVTKDEAVKLLTDVLANEGYAVMRDGRTLTIMTHAEAIKSDIPVKVSTKASEIPKNQQIVTQIIPVRYINAVQLAKDLQPLMPAQTTMTANEAGNALVITDTQQNIHRLVEIVNAIDTTVSSLSSVRVFALKYADAKTVADMIKDIFASTDTSSNTGGGRRGGFRFGPFGPGGGNDNTSNNGGRPGASKVVAAYDDRSNSLVVSAPEDLMPTIEQLVNAVDMNVTDVTEIRVFRLKYADPQEIADELTSLFPDTSNTQNNQGNFGRFFRGRFGGNNNNNESAQSDRMKKQSKVTAVPDKRTGSVVVTAAHDTMEQIAKMIEQLDSDPARKQKVYVFDVQNTDPTTVQQTLEDLFSGQGTTSSRSRSTQGQVGTQLNSRAQQQNQNRTSSTRNNTGFGGSTSGTRSFGN